MADDNEEDPAWALIDEWLTATGLTAEQMAEAMGVSAMAFDAWHRGHLPMPATMRERLKTTGLIQARRVGWLVDEDDLPEWAR